MRERRANSERFLMLAAVILRREHNVTGAGAIRRRITRRIKLWRDGKIRELVENTVATAIRGQGRSGGVEDDDAFAGRYDSMVKGSKCREAVRLLTNRLGGGVLGMEDIDAKTGKPLVEVLRDKHPDLMVPNVAGGGGIALL